MINADAEKMRVEYIVSKEELAQTLAEYWDQLDAEQGGFQKFYTQTK